MNNYYLKTIIFFTYPFISQLSLNSEPCFPNDPKGVNTESLCLESFIIHQAKPTIFMREGRVSSGYYGPELSPIIPGISLNINKSEDGYITEIINTNGKQTIKTNTGKTWELSQ